MLMMQQIEYGIYVVEQTFDQEFNRGALLNIAFKEALKMKAWDCFIFHDIDMIPFDDLKVIKFTLNIQIIDIFFSPSTQIFGFASPIPEHI